MQNQEELKDSRKYHEIIDPSQRGNLRIDERAEGYEEFTKETSGNLDTEFSIHLSATPGILGSSISKPRENPLKKKEEKRKRGMSR